MTTAYISTHTRHMHAHTFICTCKNTFIYDIIINASAIYHEYNTNKIIRCCCFINMFRVDLSMSYHIQNICGLSRARCVRYSFTHQIYPHRTRSTATGSQTHASLALL